MFMDAKFNLTGWKRHTTQGGYFSSPLLFCTGLHRWQHGDGILSFGPQCQCEPGWQRGMDAAACCCVLRLPWHRRVCSIHVPVVSRIQQRNSCKKTLLFAKMQRWCQSISAFNNTNIVVVFGRTTSQLKHEWACLEHARMQLSWLNNWCKFFSTVSCSFSWNKFVGLTLDIECIWTPNKNSVIALALYSEFVVLLKTF